MATSPRPLRALLKISDASAIATLHIPITRSRVAHEDTIAGKMKVDVFVFAIVVVVVVVVVVFNVVAVFEVSCTYTRCPIFAGNNNEKRWQQSATTKIRPNFAVHLLSVIITQQ